MSFNTTGLLEPQKPHAELLCNSLEHNHISLDASGTGMGKTFVGAAIARQRGKKFAVISPKLNIPKWKATLELFGVKPEFIINYEKLARGNTEYYRYKKSAKLTKDEVPHFLRGEFRLPKKMKDIEFYVDESHRCKGHTSLNAGLLFAAREQEIPMHLMSATQAMTPLDMRAFGYVTELHKGMNHSPTENFGMRKFKTFMEDAGAEYVGKWGAMFFDSENPESKAKLQEIRRQLFEVKKIASRMNRADFGDIFPHNQIECTPYDMGVNGDKIAKVYRDMQDELARLEKYSENYSQHIFAVLTKARRLAELYKVPTLCEITEDLIDEGKSVIIGVNYTDSIDTMYARLSKTIGEEKIGRIFGGQTFAERHADIGAFQADKKRVIIANLSAGGECIDLQDITGKHPRALLANPSYRAISVLQFIGRHDRAGAMSDCLTNLVLADGTIETSVGQKFNHKKGHLDILNDGDLVPDGISFTTSRIIQGMDV
jgi:hypothetical protein